MSLLKARIVFSKAIGELLHEINNRGLEYILDEGKRSPIQAQWNASHCRVYVDGKRCEQLDMAHDNTHAFKPIGIKESVHIHALGQDLLLIDGGKIVEAREAYEPLGAFWKGLDSNLRWGGDFKGFADLGHFSHEWKGRK